MFAAGLLPGALRAALILVFFHAVSEGAQWTLLQTLGEPPGRSQHAAIFDPVSRRMVVYGGARGSLLNDVWRLSNAEGSATAQWSQILPAGVGPDPRAGHSAVYDPIADKMLVFAGTACRNDTYTLINPFGKSPGPTAWIAVTPDSLPPARFMHTAVFDTGSRRMIVFGGENGCPLTLRNDVWVLSDLDATTPRWIHLATTGPAPPPRFGHSAIYDPATNRMLVFGGYGGASHPTATFLDDVWALSNANGLGGTPVWTRLNPAGPQPAARDFISAAYDPASDEMTIVGGLGTTFYDDVWVLRNTRTAPAWSPLPIQGATPRAPTGYSLAYSPATRTIILHGGIPGVGGGYSSETWTLANPPMLPGSVLFSNFDPGTAVDSARWSRIGADGEGGRTLGISIVPTIDGTLSRLEFWAAKESGSGRLIAHLMSDEDRSPGKVIESYSVDVPSTTPSLVSVSSSARPVLTAGRQYWLVFTTHNLVNDSILWYLVGAQPMPLVAIGSGRSPVLRVMPGVTMTARFYGDPLSGTGSPVLQSPPNQGMMPAPVNPPLTWHAVPGATSYDVYFGTSNPPAFYANTTAPIFSPGPIATSTYYWSVVARGPFGRTASAVWSFRGVVNSPSPGMRFTPVAPCRVIDTRPGQAPAFPFGPPSMGRGERRNFPLPAGRCGIPTSAQAYSVNITVVPGGPLSYLSLWSTGQPLPLVSTLNSFDGGVVANAAIVPAGVNGAISIFVTDATDVIVDVNGYFEPDTSPDALAFFAVSPCRMADTRNAPGPLGGPTLPGGLARTFPVRSSGCGLPSSVRAYSVNVTAVPNGPLGYLTLWPSGQAQPFVSTLNSPFGRIVANAALTPAGSNGDLSMFATSATDVVLDANGYFAPAPGGVSGALSFHPVAPCRIMDTRNTESPFGGPELQRGSTRIVPVPSRACAIPSGAKAYSLNITAVPSEPLGYLTAWGAASPQPFVSTLNSDGRVVANAAIVPADDNGAIALFVTNRSHIVVDVNGYFAPVTPLVPPLRTSPMDGTVVDIFPRTIRYNWQPVPGATRYGIQIDYCQPGRTDCLSWQLLTTNATTITDNFVGAQPGRWRVWSINDVTGEVSPLSNWWWFNSLR